MTPSRWRLLGFVALGIPLIIQAVAGASSAAFGALALAGAAATLALLLAGPVFRVILATLLALLGGAVILVAVSLGDPATGGGAVLGGVGGALQVVAGTFVALTAARWPRGSGRYSHIRTTGDRASEWDALSSGDDPTEGSS